MRCAHSRVSLDKHNRRSRAHFLPAFTVASSLETSQGRPQAAQSERAAMPVAVVPGGDGDGEVAPGNHLRPIPSSNSLIFGRTMSTSFSVQDLSPSPSFSARPSQSDFATPWDTAMSKELSRQLRSMVSDSASACFAFIAVHGGLERAKCMLDPLHLQLRSFVGVLLLRVEAFKLALAHARTRVSLWESALL